jgi:tetratricopeptide (TPR) repeat protein
VHALVIRCLVCALIAGQFACTPSREERIAQVRAIHAEGRFLDTAETVIELYEEVPNDPEVMRLYGKTMLAVGVPGLAVWALRRLVAHPEGNDVEAHLLLVQGLKQSGASFEAFEAAGEVVAAWPDQAEGLVLFAALALEELDYEAVLSSSERLIEIDPVRFPLAYIWQGKALLGLDQFQEADEALSFADEALARRPDIAYWRSELCKVGVEVAEAEEDEVKTVERWENCVQAFPVNEEMMSGAIRFFDEKGDRDRATAVLENAIERAPRFLWARTQLATRYATERRFSEAEALLLQATNDSEIRPSAWAALGRYHVEQENFDEAVQAFEQGLSEFKTVSAGSLAAFADAAIQAGQLDKAEGIVAQIDVPEYVALLRGRIELEKGNPNEAREYLLDGLRLFSGNSAARFLAGQTAEQLGDIDLAIEDYRDAVRSGPDDSEAAFRLAKIYEAEGKLTSAHHILSLYRSSSPDEIRILEEIAMLSIKYLPLELAQKNVDAVDALPGQQGAATILAARLEARDGGPAVGAAEIIERSRDKGLDLTLPQYVEVLRQLVDFLRRSEQSLDGLERARAAVAAHPDFAPFHEILAAALISADGPKEEIEAAWTRAIELDAKSVRALIGLADLAAEAGQVDEALELYDLATEADRKETHAAWRAIRVLLSGSMEEASDSSTDEGDDPDEREEAGEVAKGRDSESLVAGTTATTATTPTTEDRSDEIDERLDTLLRRDPIHVRALNLRARRLVEDRSDLDRAEALAQRSVRFGGNVQALETLGLVSLEMGEDARAVRAFQLALRRRPKASYLRYHLGRAFLAAGNEEAARTAFERSLEGEEFDAASDARQLLAKLNADSSAKLEAATGDEQEGVPSDD